MGKTKQITLTKEQREKVLKAVHDTVGTKEYFLVNNCLWEVLRYKIINPPKRGNKWVGLRWLMSQLAKFALNDFQK